MDCSKQNDSIKNSAVHLRLEFKSRDNFPENTIAYCLILHDRIVEYDPALRDVRKGSS